MKFVGREREITALKEKNWRPHARLVVIYGRRRVGKTALVEQAYAKDIVWKIEGIEHGNTRTQIAYYLKQLSQCASPDKNLEASDWSGALDLLEHHISMVARPPSKRLVVFLDEFQWLCEMKPELVSIFKYHYDNCLSKHVYCEFVICGSVSSFIVKKVIQSRALYGRVDLEINLQPLNVQESRDLLAKTRCESQVLDVHMTLGGVPQYLLELNPELSLLQNLNEYAFTSHGFFFREFQRLFISHFAGSPYYEKVLRALSQKALTPPELSRKCGLASGGGLTERLEDLELAGFIERRVPVDKKPSSRLVRYGLCDEFLHFYFRFIAPHSPEIIRGKMNFRAMLNTRDYQQWQGLAFERLCRKHARDIAEALRFSAVDYRQGTWFRRAAGTNGAQVDLIFVRADKVLTVCEVKHAAKLQATKVAADLARKVDVLQEAFPSYAIERVLILGKPVNSRDRLVQSFDHVLTAEQIWG